MRRTSGFQLVEAVISLAVLLLAAGILVPPLLRLSADSRVRLAAGELTGVLRQARAYAIRHSSRVGVKFFPEGERVRWALFRDGDGDGVLTKDIDSGDDPQVTPVRTLTHLGRHVRFGFPPGPPPSDPGDPRRRLDRLHDPIRFNRSDIASFGPLGGSTPGSLYITDSLSRLAVVRVHGRSGRVRVLVWDARKELWR